MSECDDEEYLYQMDVMYEVWRDGGNTDCIDYDRVFNHHVKGDSYEVAARAELRAQRPKLQESSEEESKYEP